MPDANIGGGKSILVISENIATEESLRLAWEPQKEGFLPPPPAAGESLPQGPARCSESQESPAGSTWAPTSFARKSLNLGS